VCLQAQAPLGVLHAVTDGCGGVSVAYRAIHGLQKEMPKGQAFKCFGLGVSLRVDELQFIAACL
jgi:hypothetical protein